MSIKIDSYELFGHFTHTHTHTHMSTHSHTQSNYIVIYFCSIYKERVLNIGDRANVNLRGEHRLRVNEAWWLSVSKLCDYKTMSSLIDECISLQYPYIYIYK